MNEKWTKNFKLFRSLLKQGFSKQQIRSADLRSADLRYADLRSANLRYANLSYANLSYANLSSAENLDKTIYNEYTYCICINCPEEGEFIAYKKCNNKIVTIKVLADAKRSSATSLKCRCSKAFVLNIEDGLTEIASNYDNKFIYKVGEVISVDNFDENRWNERSTGIHFFMNKEMARQYNN